MVKKVGLKLAKMDFKGIFLNMDFDPFLTHPHTQIWTSLYFFNPSLKYLTLDLLYLYLGSWRHLSVKIFRSRCIVKTFRDQSYIYMEAIYQISAQSETWIDTVSEGEVLAPFT